MVNTVRHGFALPSIMIASIVMLTVLVTTVAAVSTTRVALDEQYYNQLAKEAAESGIAKATACIRQNFYLMPWKDAGGTLTPSTDCEGYVTTGASGFVAHQDTLRSTFELVKSETNGAYYSIESKGKVQLLRKSNGAVWREYTYSLKMTLNYVGAYATKSASGYAQVCGIINGETWCWGTGNTYGKLGSGTTDSALVPVQVLREASVLANKVDTDIAVGNNFACSVSDGQVYCWGRNNFGQLGRNTINTEANPSPAAVTMQTGLLSGRTIKQVVAGGRHACALATDGNVFCWGYNSNGQLGNNSTTDSSKPVSAMTGALSGKNVTKIAAVPDVDATCALAGGEAYCWGRNSAGELGVGNSAAYIATPQKVAGLLADKTVTDIALSSQGNSTLGSGARAHACAVADGQAYCWGSNDRGMLGNNSQVDSNVPVQVYRASGVLLGRTVIRVVTGHPHSCVLTSDNKVFCWGVNDHGQLGINDTAVADSSVPLPVYSGNADGYGLEGRTITDIIGGGNRACVIASGTNFCWGLNAQYQIGDGTNISRFRATIASYLEYRRPPLIY